MERGWSSLKSLTMMLPSPAEGGMHPLRRPWWMTVPRFYTWDVEGDRADETGD